VWDGREQAVDIEIEIEIEFKADVDVDVAEASRGAGELAVESVWGLRLKRLPRTEY